MRHFLSVLILCAGLSLPAIAVAQEETQTEQEVEQSKPSVQEEGEQDKADKEQVPSGDESAANDEEFDIEGYFKRGEDNIYKGSNCAPPPDLIT